MVPPFQKAFNYVPKSFRKPSEGGCLIILLFKLTEQREANLSYRVMSNQSAVGRRKAARAAGFGAQRLECFRNVLIKSAVDLRCSS